MTDKTDAELFADAIQAHQDALERFGEDDPRTINALLRLMLLAPLDAFIEIEQLAHATKH